MIAQQQNLDTIANNLANVNTAGFKKEFAQFESLLYQKLQTKTTDNEGQPKPVIGQVGLGVRTSAIVSGFSQGSLLATDLPFNFAIEGNGFFAVRKYDGSTAYTRNGAFGLALMEDGTWALSNADGFAVLDMDGEPITFPADIDASKIQIDPYGNISYPDAEGVIAARAVIGRTQFNNPAGLLKMSGSLFAATENSGEPRVEAEDTALKLSKVHVGYLEASNVQIADEMVNMIVAQRAYETNSKSIQASDEMLQQANNLRS
jgi:flagellar basal-body rod protein FlgG